MEKKNLTDIMVADRLGKSRQAVHDIKNKQHINTKLLYSLCEILDVNIIQFFIDPKDHYQANNKFSEVNELPGSNSSNNQSNQNSEMQIIKELMKELRDENYNLKRKNELLIDLLNDHGIKFNQTG